jgi:outer membrane protein
MNRLRSLLAAAAAIISCGLQAQPTPPVQAPGELTLEECIRRALDRNLGLEAQRFNPQIAEENIVIAREAFLPSFSLSTSRGAARSAPTSVGPGTKSEFSDTRVAVGQRFLTGTVVDVSTRVDRSEFNPTAAALNPAYNADLSIGFRQPLLAGFGWLVNRAALDVARIGLDRANLEYRARALDTIQDTELAYYNLAFAREQLAVREFSRSLAQRLFDEAQTRLNTGVATDLDVLQAEVGVANAQRGVILAQQAVKDRSDQLLAIIGQFELDAPLGTTRFKTVENTVPLFASSLNAAKQNQPDYLAAQLALEQSRVNLRVSKSNRLPDLSVGGAVGFDGSDRSGSRAYSDVFDRESSSWQVDLSLNFAWGQTGDRARYRQSLASVTQQEIRLREQEQGIEVQVRSAVRAVETNLESVRIASLASRLSERQYDLERARFEAGLSTSRRVLEAQNDLENARNAELQAQVNLSTAYTNLHRIEGSSLQRYGITL